MLGAVLHSQQLAEVAVGVAGRLPAFPSTRITGMFSSPWTRSASEIAASSIAPMDRTTSGWRLMISSTLPVVFLPNQPPRPVTVRYFSGMYSFSSAVGLMFQPMSMSGARVYMRLVPMGLVQKTVLMGLGIFTVRPAWSVKSTRGRVSAVDAVVAVTAAVVVGRPAAVVVVAPPPPHAATRTARTSTTTSRAGPIHLNVRSSTLSLLIVRPAPRPRMPTCCGPHRP